MKKLYRIISILTLSFCLFNVFNEPIKVFASDPIVSFADPVLQNYMCAWVGKAPGSILYLSDLKAHEGQNILIPSGVSSLSGMENLGGITIPKIMIAQGTISDLSPIKDINGVTDLEIIHNNVSDISCLDNYSNLRTVYLYDNKITDISVASNWKDVQLVDLSYNNISNISAAKFWKSAQNINLENNHIADISPLSGLTTLQALNIAWNDVTDISTLSSLIGLTFLNIQQNGISSLAPLSNLPDLNVLVFDDTNVTDLTPLKNLLTLKEIYMTGNNISDLSPLSGLINLNILIAEMDSFSSIDSLKNLSKLQSLDIHFNKVSDISPLSGIITLQSLDIGCNNIIDISPLKNLMNLTSLIANQNKISDLSVLNGLTKLLTLNIMGNRIIDFTPIISLTGVQTLDVSYNHCNIFVPGSVKTYLDNVSAVNKNTIPQLKFFVDKNNLNLSEGNTYTLQYNISGTTDGTFTTPNNFNTIDSSSEIVITSADPSIATVDQNGKITAVKSGSTTITAKLYGFNSVYTKQDITVNVLEPVKGNITIKYQDQNGTDIHDSNVISNLNLGTYTESAKSFPGYLLNDRSSKSVTLTDSNPDQTIIFRYTKIKGSITIKYQDENGTNLQNPDVFSNLDLGIYTENAKSFPGYKLNDDSSKIVTLTDNSPDQTIIFNYKTIKGSITIKYQDENGKDIQAPDILSDLDLDTYTENAKVILGYNLHDALSKTVTLTYSNFDQTIIFSYVKIKGSITIKYQNENGTDIETPDILSNLDMGSYTENAKVILGYNLHDTLSKTVTLTDNNPEQTIIFSYAKIKGSITVKYQDENGKDIQAPDVLNNLDMGIYTEAAKTIPGYELNDTITKVVILDDINPNKSIIFNYKLVKGTIEGYVKDNSGRPLNDAKIELDGKQISTLTDSTGYYKFSGVDMGNYTVRILDVNYKLLKEINISLTVNSNENPVTKTVDNINSASQNLSLSHEYNRQEVDFILVPADETPLESIEILPHTGFPINTESLSLLGSFMALIGAFLIKFKIKR